MYKLNDCIVDYADKDDIAVSVAMNNDYIIYNISSENSAICGNIITDGIYTYIDTIIEHNEATDNTQISILFDNKPDIVLLECDGSWYKKMENYTDIHL